MHGTLAKTHVLISVEEDSLFQVLPITHMVGFSPTWFESSSHWPIAPQYYGPSFIEKPCKILMIDSNIINFIMLLVKINKSLILAEITCETEANRLRENEAAKRRIPDSVDLQEVVANLQQVLCEMQSQMADKEESILELKTRILQLERLTFRIDSALKPNIIEPVSLVNYVLHYFNNNLMYLQEIISSWTTQG